MVAPLYTLLKKSIPWHWGQEQKDAFMALKRAVVQAPVLAYPQVGKPFYLDLATIHTHIGVILFQQSRTSRKPVAYGSRVLSEVEKKNLTHVNVKYLL